MIRWAQKGLDTPPGAVLGRWAYAAVAHGAAAAFARLPATDGVHLAGSAAAGWHAVEPGRSDLDLVVLARLPTLQDELLHLAGMRRLRRRLHTVVPLFAHVDCIEVRDLHQVRSFGNAWTFALERDWCRMAGPDRVSVPVPRGAFERQIERFRLALRRWCKAAPYALFAERERVARTRVAHRLLKAIVAARLGDHRHRPWDELAAAGRAAGLLPAGWDAADPDEVLPIALLCLDEWTRELEDGSGPPVGVEGDPPPPPEEARGLARSLMVEGVGSVLWCRRDLAGETGMVVARGAVGDPPAELLGRVARGGWQPRDPRLGWASGPVPLTPALVRALPLLDPVPVAGGSLGFRDAVLAGEPVQPPRWTSAGARPVALASRIAHLLWRPRGRLLRGRNANDLGAHQAVWREMEPGPEALLALRGGGRLRFAPRPGALPPEAELVDRMRDRMDRARAVLSAWEA